MAKRHLTFDCPVCHEPDEVVARVQPKTVNLGTGENRVLGADPGESGRWICFACRAEGVWSVTLTADQSPESAA